MTAASFLALILFVGAQWTLGFRILAVFPVRSREHFAGPEVLLRRLAAGGHSLDVISHFPQTDAPVNYRDVIVLGGPDDGDEDGRWSESLDFRRNSLRTIGKRACEYMARPDMQDLIKNSPKDPPYDILLLQIFPAPCYLALGPHLNATTVVLSTDGFSGWQHCYTGNPYRPTSRHFLARVADLLATVLRCQLIGRYASEQDAIARRFIAAEVPAIDDLTGSIALILADSHRYVHGARKLQRRVKEVGGYELFQGAENSTLPADVEKWLDESEDGFVLVSTDALGKSEKIAREAAEILGRSFEKIGPVRVLLEGQSDDRFQDKLPGNVVSRKFLSHSLVLRHRNARAYVTESKTSRIFQGIASGVPMITVSTEDYQLKNSEIVVKKKIGINIYGRLTERRLTKAIDTILHDCSYRVNAKRLAIMFLDRPMKALDEAVYWLEFAGRHGNVLQLPVNRSRWACQNFLNVHLTLLFALSWAVLVMCLTARCLYCVYYISARKTQSTAEKPTKTKKEN